MFNKDSFIGKQFRGQGFMTVAKFNSSGDLLFIGDKDSKTISLVSVDNNKIIGTYNGHNGVIWHLDITKDSKYMISCSGDMSCIIWDVMNGNIITRISETGIPKYVSINGDNVVIACDPISKRSKSYITIYSLDKIISGDTIPNYKFVETEQIRATTLSFINDETLLITYDNGFIKKLNLKTSEKFMEKNIHSDSIKSICLSNDKKKFLTSSLDKTAKIIDIDTFEELACFKSKVPINYAIFTPKNDYVLLGGGIEAMMVAKTSENDLTTKVFEVSSQKLIKVINNHFGPLRYIDFNSNENCFVTASQDGIAKIHYFSNIPKSNDSFELFGNAVYKEEDELELFDETIKIEDYNENEVKNSKKDGKPEKIYPVGHTLHKAEIKVSDYVISTSSKSSEPREISAVKVSNLPEDIDIRDLWDMFEYYGRIEHNGIRLKKVYDGTIAFVNYLNSESAKKAIEKCDKKRLGYCVISVEMAKYSQ
jgi:translation initiation factor 3 subunit I